MTIVICQSCRGVGCSVCNNLGEINQVQVTNRWGPEYTEWTTIVETVTPVPAPAPPEPEEDDEDPDNGCRHLEI